MTVTGPSSNPFAPFNVTVLVPEKIEIKMVDASALGEYEIWVFFASLLSNGVVGFFIAWRQALDSNSPSGTSYFWSFILFLLLFIAAFGRAIWRRIVLQRRSKTIALGVSQATAPSVNPTV